MLVQSLLTGILIQLGKKYKIHKYFMIAQDSRVCQWIKITLDRLDSSNNFLS